MNKKIFFLITIIAQVSLCALGQNGKKYFKAGNEFVDNLKYEEAIAQYTSAIGLEPSNSNYYFVRGKTYEKLLKFDEAKADYEKSIVFEPKEAEVIISLGAVCNKLGKYNEALVHLNRASRVDKRNPRVYHEKIITLIGLEKYDQALRVSDTAIIIKDSPMNYYYRGLCYVKLNNDILGRKELEKAISKDKKLAEPRLALADLLISTDPQEAMNQ